MEKSEFMSKLDTLERNLKPTSNQKVFLKDLLCEIYSELLDEWNWSQFGSFNLSSGGTLSGYEIPAAFEKTFTSFVERNLKKIPCVSYASFAAYRSRFSGNRKFLVEFKYELYGSLNQ